MKFNKIEMNGFTLYHIPNNKFKTFTIGGYFFRPLQKEGMIESSILSNMMMKYNENYPSEKELTKYLEDLYGTTLYVGFNRMALVNAMSFVIKMINDEYLENKDVNLLDEAIKLLNDTINKPIFDEDKFNLEKELLIEDIKRVHDNKVQYATLQFIKTMYKDEMCRHSIASMLEEAENVTLEDIKKEYKKLFNSKKVFYVIGNVDFDKVVKAFEILKFEQTNVDNLNFLDYETKDFEKPIEIIEQENNNQSIVIMGYRTEIRENNDLYPAMFLLNNMLGGYFHSTLFQEIREKHSLAYSISSDYSSKKGTFVITAGISRDKYSEFKEIVNKIIQDYKDGFIDDDTILMTKKMLVNAQYKIADQPSHGMGSILKDINNETDSSLEEKIEKINNITKEELILASKKLKLDTIYFLEGTK